MSSSDPLIPFTQEGVGAAGRYSRIAQHAANRPLSKSTVRGFAEAMSRGDWIVTHQGMAFSSTGVLVDWQHAWRRSSRSTSP